VRGSWSLRGRGSGSRRRWIAGCTGKVRLSVSGGSLCGADSPVEDLSGLKVAHGEDAFEEGEEVILTLKDNRILDPDAEDELQNVNLADAEAERRARERKKKAKAQYTGYDDEEFEEGEDGVGKKKSVLSKYDDSDFTMGSAGGEGFRLGGQGERKRPRVEAMEQGEEMINLGVNRQLMNMDYNSELLAGVVSLADGVCRKL
jgi:hypothetical protein